MRGGPEETKQLFYYVDIDDSISLLAAQEFATARTLKPFRHQLRCSSINIIYSDKRRIKASAAAGARSLAPLMK
jgi:hypothetical protein